MEDSKVWFIICGIGYWIHGRNEIRMAKRMIKNSKKNKKELSQQ